VSQFEKKILVTGGFGFIGCTLVEQLLAEEPGAYVHVVDDLSTSPVFVEDFLATIGHPVNFGYDICTVEKFFGDGPADDWNEIYHLASPVGPAGVLAHAGNMVRDVVRDMYLIIDYCLATGARLLDVSTSEIYGGGVDGYCTETTAKIVPAKTTVRLEYAIAKLAAETAIINTCGAKGLSATIIRPFNVSGPRQSPRGGFVIPRFAQQAAAGAPITVFGDGSAIRAFTHVKDMANGIVLGMRKGANGEAYNIGNPANKTTILRLAELVRRTVESRSEIAFIDPKTIYGPKYEEASDKYPDADKAMDELGWRPRYDTETVIQDYWGEYMRQVKAGSLKDAV
jgi:nucleoside-diphosphate-sugar epimerase